MDGVKAMQIQKDSQKLDAEWIELVEEAKELGLTVDEIRRYLKNGAIPEGKTEEALVKKVP